MKRKRAGTSPSQNPSYCVPQSEKRDERKSKFDRWSIVLEQIVLTPQKIIYEQQNDCVYLVDQFFM